MEKFLAGYNCAQAFLFAFGQGGAGEDTALETGHRHGRRIARRGRNRAVRCDRGILALGLKYGRGNRQDRSAAEQTYQKRQSY